MKLFDRRTKRTKNKKNECWSALRMGLRIVFCGENYGGKGGGILRTGLVYEQEEIPYNLQSFAISDAR